MGNQCIQCFRNLIVKQPLNAMSELNQIDHHQQDETYTKVEIIDESENYHEHSESQIININDSIQETINSSIDIFLYRLKTTKDFEELYRDEKINIQFKSYKLADRNTICQVKFEFPLQKVPIEEFLNYSYLDNIEQFTTLQTNSEYQLIQASFKKIQFIDQREYIYIKYQKRLTPTKILQVIRSVNIDTSPLSTRGYIFISGFLIKEKGSEISVEAYAEIDFKIKLPPGMIKKALSNELRRILKQFII